MKVRVETQIIYGNREHSSSPCCLSRRRFSMNLDTVALRLSSKSVCATNLLLSAFGYFARKAFQAFPSAACESLSDWGDCSQLSQLFPVGRLSFGWGFCQLSYRRCRHVLHCPPILRVIIHCLCNDMFFFSIEYLRGLGYNGCALCCRIR